MRENRRVRTRGGAGQTGLLGLRRAGLVATAAARQTKSRQIAIAFVYAPRPRSVRSARGRAAPACFSFARWWPTAQPTAAPANAVVPRHMPDHATGRRAGKTSRLSAAHQRQAEREGGANRVLNIDCLLEIFTVDPSRTCPPLEGSRARRPVAAASRALLQPRAWGNGTKRR